MGEVILDNSNLKVLKVMACKESWINKYYDQPQQEYEKEQNSEPITISNESSESSNKRFNLKWYCDCCRDSPYVALMLVAIYVIATVMDAVIEDVQVIAFVKLVRL